jgi:hypothetical protein
MAHDPTSSVDHGHGTGRPSVDVAGQRFRVRTPRVSPQWLPNTPSNCPITVVWLRLQTPLSGPGGCAGRAQASDGRASP